MQYEEHAILLRIHVCTCDEEQEWAMVRQKRKFGDY